MLTPLFNAVMQVRGLPVAAAAKLGGAGAVLSGFTPGARLLLIGAYAVLIAVGLARFGLAGGAASCATVERLC